MLDHFRVTDTPKYRVEGVAHIHPKRIVTMPGNLEVVCFLQKYVLIHFQRAYDFAIIILNEPLDVCDNAQSLLPVPIPLNFVRTNGKYSVQSKFTNAQLNRTICRNYGYGRTCDPLSGDNCSML